MLLSSAHFYSGGKSIIILDASALRMTTGTQACQQSNADQQMAFRNR